MSFDIRSSTSSGFLPPLSSSSSTQSSASQFNDYVNDLFRAALRTDKNLSRQRLKNPTFGNRIVKTLPTGVTNINRIVILNTLARDHIKTFRKQEIQSLIYAVGMSDYVASCSEEDVNGLYKSLFSYPQCQSFSKLELLDFEKKANQKLHSSIFLRILQHPSLVEDSSITINNLAREHIGYLPKPHIQYLVYTIDRSDSSIDTKMEILESSLFRYPEFSDFSKRELIALERLATPELRSQLLAWILMCHPAFGEASLIDFNFLISELDETDCSREAKINFVSNMLEHPSLNLLAKKIQP
jgi:hypothetical protein